MFFLRILFMALVLLLFGYPQCGNAADDSKLLKIVALSRHGVRSPTQSPKMLSSWSQKTWPSWPVASGDLTPRGAKLVTAMWNDLRGKLQDFDILPKEECPMSSAIYVRADVDERTKATARALLDGLAPGCSLGFAVVKEKVDPLFHPMKAGLYRFDPIPAVTDVLSMTNGGLSALQDDFSGALALMGKISGPPASNLCLRYTTMPNCQIADLPNAVSVSADGQDIRLVGALSIGSSMAEIFLLEYGQWPDTPAGWGQIDATTLSQILPIHSKIFDVVNRAPVVAWAKGSSLLTEMKDALLGTHYDPRCNDAKLVVYVGHDTNIANVGSLLGIEWQAPGYPPNGIPPAGVLFLELWEKEGSRHIEAHFFAQPPRALHAPFDNGSGTGGSNHAPVAAIVSAPPVVGQARFEIDQFINIVKNATEGAPIAPLQNPPLDFGNVIPAKP